MESDRQSAQAARRVVIADQSADNRQWLRRALGDGYVVEEYETCAETLAALAAPPDLLIVGHALRDGTGARLLAEARALGDGIVSLLIADGEHPEGEGDGGGEGSPVFYVLKRTVPAGDVRALVDSAVRRPPPRKEAPSRPGSAVEAARLQRILEVSRRLATQRDLRGAAQVAVDAVLEFCGADRAHCLFHDADSGALWAEVADEGGADRSAAAGLAGFAARTTAPVVVARAADDPRYARAVDDPRGRGDERVLAQPVLGGDGEVHAVLVAVRAGSGPEFELEAREALASLARQWGPLLTHLALDVEAQAVLAEAREAGGGERDIFRREALEASAARRVRGDVVRVSPSWVRWSYWVVVAVVLIGIVYTAVGTVNQYSTGPALVRSTGRTDVTAPVAGTLVSVEAVPGQRVEAGALLARFYDAAEEAEFRRVDNQWEAQLRNYLFDPTDEITRRALAALRAERERAVARLEERAVRAPQAGVVSDVRGREGQHLVAGDILMTLAAEASDLYLIALLPGADRPQIEPGMPLRLELSGYRYAYQRLSVEAVADEVVGPAEARRYLGKEIAELPIPPSVVIVTARLPSATFEADGQIYRYHDGMHGTAEIRIRSERIVTALIPGLKGL